MSISVKKAILKIYKKTKMKTKKHSMSNPVAKSSENRVTKNS